MKDKTENGSRVSNKVEECETKKTRQLESAAETTYTNHKNAQNRGTILPHAQQRAVGIKKMFAR